MLSDVKNLCFWNKPTKAQTIQVIFAACRGKRQICGWWICHSKSNAAKCSKNWGKYQKFISIKSTTFVIFQGSCFKKKPILITMFIEIRKNLIINPYFYVWFFQKRLLANDVAFYSHFAKKINICTFQKQFLW